MNPPDLDPPVLLQDPERQKVLLTDGENRGSQGIKQLQQRLGSSNASIQACSDSALHSEPILSTDLDGYNCWLSFQKIKFPTLFVSSC